jgi:beta-glucosidase
LRRRCVPGKIPESVVDEAVRRILRVKFALGLFEHPYTPVTPAYEPRGEPCAGTRCGGETIVLLKNDPIEGVGALLPLTARAKKVALIGPLADSAKDMLGSWGALGDPKFAPSRCARLCRSGWAIACSMRRAAECLRRG